MLSCGCCALAPGAGAFSAAALQRPALAGGGWGVRRRRAAPARALASSGRTQREPLHPLESCPLPVAARVRSLRLAAAPAPSWAASAEEEEEAAALRRGGAAEAHGADRVLLLRLHASPATAASPPPSPRTPTAGSPRSSWPTRACWSPAPSCATLGRRRWQALEASAPAAQPRGLGGAAALPLRRAGQGLRAAGRRGAPRVRLPLL